MENLAEKHSSFQIFSDVLNGQHLRPHIQSVNPPDVQILLEGRKLDRGLHLAHRVASYHVTYPSVWHIWS